MLQMLLPSGHLIPTVTLTVVAVGMLVLAAADVWKQEVEDWATMLLAFVAVAALVAEGIAPQQWVGAILGSATTFALYLLMGLHGYMGGGDVKLAAVPGLVLGAVHPFLALWWVAASVTIQQALFLAIARTSRVATGKPASVVAALPHVPAMAAGILVSTLIFVQ